MQPFPNRSAAALQLAKRLKRFAGRQDVCVVALEGNGERVGADLSRALGVRCGVLRGGRVIALPADMHWRIAILVDDAIGDEAPLTRGITALRDADIADRIIAAAPVGASDVCARLRCLADECVVALASFPFKGASAWYDDGVASAEVIGSGSPQPRLLRTRN